MRNSNKCTKDILCDECDKLVNQYLKISVDLNEIKREAPNEFGHMLPKYITIWMIKVNLGIWCKFINSHDLIPILSGTNIFQV